MVVWQMPCESSSPPGSQLSQKAQSKDWAFLHFTSCKMSFGPASLSKSAPADLCLLEFSGEPFEQGIPHATKTSGTFLDRHRRVPQGRTPGWGEHCSSPSDGQDRPLSRHRARIQSQSASIQNKTAQTTTKTRSTNSHLLDLLQVLNPTICHFYPKYLLRCLLFNRIKQQRKIIYCGLLP